MTFPYWIPEDLPGYRFNSPIHTQLWKNVTRPLVDIHGDHWLWKGGIHHRDGQPTSSSIGNRSVRAFLYWSLMFKDGEIAAAYRIRHNVYLKCGVALCLNPYHMEHKLKGNHLHPAK